MTDKRHKLMAHMDAKRAEKQKHIGACRFCKGNAVIFLLPGKNAESQIGHQVGCVVCSARGPAALHSEGPDSHGRAITLWNSVGLSEIPKDVLDTLHKAKIDAGYNPFGGQGINQDLMDELLLSVLKRVDRTLKPTVSQFVTHLSNGKTAVFEVASIEALVARSHLATALEAEVLKLEEEGAKLAAWQCLFHDGKTGLVCDEGGGQFCAMQARVDDLTKQLHGLSEEAKLAATWLQSSLKCEAHPWDADQREMAEASVAAIIGSE